LNLGIAGTGPVSPLSKWYNKTMPQYQLNPAEAKQILADAGYLVNDGGTYLSGDAAKTAAGNGNWWVNPDKSLIGSSTDGLIEILTPEANYDPRSANEGLMIAQQLRDIGINAKSVAMDFTAIATIIGNPQYTTPGERNFDMYLSSWRIGSDPSDFLHEFFHSSQAATGYNYAGYQNASFDEIIDLARSTSDDAVKKKAIFDAQAAIGYDLPIDVLYFRTNIEAYRSDRFTGWVTGATGSIFCWESIMNIRAPSPFKVKAQFVNTPSAIISNSTDTQITIFVKDQNGNPLSGAMVKLKASVGKLATEIGNTSSAGKFTTTYVAPYANPLDPEIVKNGTQAIIQIESATYVPFDGTLYDPAPSRLALIKVFPVDAVFLSVSMSADPDIIDPDVAPDGTLGFTYVDVFVMDQNGEPVQGASVGLSVAPAIPNIEPTDQLTDAEGKARFKVTATDLPNNDGLEMQFVLEAIVIHPEDTNIRGENSVIIIIEDSWVEPIHHPDYSNLLYVLVVPAIMLAIIFLVIFVIMLLGAKLRL
jgi:hypothetical protein